MQYSLIGRFNERERIQLEQQVGHTARDLFNPDFMALDVITGEGFEKLAHVTHVILRIQDMIPVVDLVQGDKQAHERVMLSCMIDLLHRHKITRVTCVDMSRTSQTELMRQGFDVDIAKTAVLKRLAHMPRTEVGTKRAWSCQTTTCTTQVQARTLVIRYAAFLTRLNLGLLKIVHDEHVFTICIRGMAKPLLHMTVLDETDDRIILEIQSGMLVKNIEGSKGRFVFKRLTGTYTYAFVLDCFAPALPWHVYRYTQACVHGCVMHMFGKRLK